MNTFNLSFSNKIGKRISLSDEGEDYCGEYIPGRFYTGIFGGSFYKSDGIYFRVDNRMIKINVTTLITFGD